jgi:hypothetical protein
VCLTSEAKGDMHYGGTSPFYLNTEKRSLTESSPQDPPSTHNCVPVDCQQARVASERTMWSSKLLEIFKVVVRRGFKSWLALCIVGVMGLNFEIMRG